MYPAVLAGWYVGRSRVMGMMALPPAAGPLAIETIEPTQYAPPPADASPTDGTPKASEPPSGMSGSPRKIAVPCEAGT